jgi:hypothetical protein
MGLVSLIAVAGEALVYGSDKDALEWTGIGLTLVGVGFSIGANRNGRRARDELSQSIWFYNSRFAR